MIACESTAGPCAYARVFTHRQPLVQPTHSTCGHEEHWRYSRGTVSQWLTRGRDRHGAPAPAGAFPDGAFDASHLCCDVFPYRSDCCGTPLAFDMFLDPVLKNVRDIQVVLVHHHHVVVAENTDVS
jgi:hypothetical protein